MTNCCTECGYEGGFVKVRKRKLPCSSPKILCKNCYNEISQIENEILRKITLRKEKLLRRMYENVIKKFCREKSIPISERRSTTAVSRRGTRYRRYITYYYTYDELINLLIDKTTVDDITDFAKRNKVPINDIIDEIESERELESIEEEDMSSDDPLYNEICTVIKSFTPLLKYDFELPYQIDLARYLKEKFPSTKIEVQRGSSRPDIVVDGFAIEIKGPTEQKDLDSIPSKCMRYPQHFKRGMIVVLFNLQTTDRFYDEWKNGI